MRVAISPPLSRAQELLGLSASLLEKEQMLKSAGLGEANDAAVTRASHNVMMEELEELKGFKCKVRIPATQLLVSLLLPLCTYDVASLSLN